MPPLSVQDRLAKARAAKKAKRLNSPFIPVNRVKLISITHSVPVSKTCQSPIERIVHVGVRGGGFYINKNGNRTYLSSNQ